MAIAHRDLDDETNRIAEVIVQAVGDVRAELGAGLVESVYVECLADELRSRGLRVETEVSVPLSYKGRALQKTYRIDLLVEGGKSLRAGIHRFVRTSS